MKLQYTNMHTEHIIILHEQAWAVPAVAFLLPGSSSSKRGTLSPPACRPPLERRQWEIQRAVERIAAPWRRFSLTNPGDCADLLYEHLALPPPPSAAVGKHGDRSTKVLNAVTGKHGDRSTNLFGACHGWLNPSVSSFDISC